MAPVEFPVEEREVAQIISKHSPIMFRKDMEEFLLTPDVGLKNRKAQPEIVQQPLTEAELRLEEKLKNREQKIIWRNVFLIAGLHATTAFGVYHYVGTFLWKTIFFSIIYGRISGIGVTAGAHRLYTHKSFKAKKPLELIIMLLYTMAGLNPMFEWVRDHRVHHKFSETDADPHNANRGFFFAHCGWLMMTKHPEVLRKGAKVDMSDITSNPILQFHQKYYVPLYFLFVMIIPTVIPSLWGETLLNACLINWFRYCYLLHSVWLVNSAAHLYGNKPYDKLVSFISLAVKLIIDDLQISDLVVVNSRQFNSVKLSAVHNNLFRNLKIINNDKIMPTQCWWVSFFAMGEGWHNYHHVFPWDYKCDELGLKLNETTRFINFFAKIGWAYDLKVASDQLVKATVENHGDESHPIYKRAIPAN